MISIETCYNISGNPGERNSQPSLFTMKKNFILPFLIALLILILSEYFFLQEVFGRNNIPILLLTGMGIAASIISIVSLIRKYN